MSPESRLMAALRFCAPDSRHPGLKVRKRFCRKARGSAGGGKAPPPLRSNPARSKRGSRPAAADQRRGGITPAQAETRADEARVAKHEPLTHGCREAPSCLKRTQHEKGGPQAAQACTTKPFR